MLSDKNPAKNMNENWKNNISKSLKGIVFSYEHKKNLGKPVNQLELNNKFIKKWDSLTDVATYFNKKTTKPLIKALKKERESYLNYQWTYYTEAFR